MQTKNHGNIQQLIKTHEADQKKLQSCEDKLAKLKPEWMKRTEEAERLVALNSAYPGTTRAGNTNRPLSDIRGGTYEPFWVERSAMLDEQIEAACKLRDELTADLAPEIRALRQKIEQRMQCLAGGFASWLGGIAQIQYRPGYEPNVNDGVTAMIESMKQTANKISDIAELLKFIEQSVTEIEESKIEVRLFRFDVLIQGALEIQ
jgi:hypothetical protein